MQKIKVTPAIMKELGFIQEPNCWKLYEKGTLVNLIYNNQLENRTLGDVVKIMTGTAHNIGFKKGSNKKEVVSEEYPHYVNTTTSL